VDGRRVVRFAYADPPYYGKAAIHYGKHHPDAADWDDEQTHLDLIARLCDEFPDGWALSLNSTHLAWQLPACPGDARVAAWVKKFHQIRPMTVQYAWEPVIWRGGRKDHKRTPMVRDWFASHPTMRRGLSGAKPDDFNRWILDLLNFDPAEDEIVDLFPGTGGMAVTLGAPPLDFG
jgi:hypothetical protein